MARRKTEPAAHLTIPLEKQCARCKEVKSWKEFYIVPSYPDGLSRLCKKPCSSLDGRTMQHKRQLKKQGPEKFAARIELARANLEDMENVLREYLRKQSATVRSERTR